MPTPEIHSILGASSAGRWIPCPPSAKLAAEAPKTTSDYAEAGRVAHAIGELKARKYFLEGIGPRKFSSMLKKLQSDPHYDPDMDSATDLYLDTLKELALTFDRPPFVALETRVDYGDIAPGGFGTADGIMIGGDTIVVADYKNGSGVPVEAEDNPQMKLYAYGALRTFGVIFGDAIQKVRPVIIQPHSGGVKMWETSRAELERWAHEVVAPAAALAAEGKGDFRAGDWCDHYFCPARATCRTRAEHLLSLTSLEGATPEGSIKPEEAEEYKRISEYDPSMPPLLSDDEVGNVLNIAKSLAKWVKSLEDYAFESIMSGKPIAGWKVVEGRSNRAWAGGADEAFPKLLEAGIPEAILYERKPVSPTALEKAVGKEKYAEKVAGLVIKPPGKPTLAAADDERPDYQQAQAENAFKVVGRE